MAQCEYCKSTLKGEATVCSQCGKDVARGFLANAKNALFGLGHEEERRQKADDAYRRQMAAGLAAVEANTAAQLVVAESQLAQQARIAENTEELVELSSLQLIELERTSAAVEQSNGILQSLRADLSVGFEGIESSLRSTEAAIESGFARIDATLQDIGVKVTWSDTYKRFISFKRNALNLAHNKDYARAIQQGLAAVAVSDGSGVIDDDIERDPELNLLLARLMLRQLGEEGASALPANPMDLCIKALEKGRLSMSPSDRQTASEAAHEVARLLRVVGKRDEAIRYDEQSFQLSQSRNAETIARLLASHVMDGEEPKVADAAFTAMLVQPRVVLAFLTQSALAARPAASARVIEATRDLARQSNQEVNVALEAQSEMWKRTMAPNPHAPKWASVGMVAKEDEALLTSISTVRAALQCMWSNDVAMFGWLVSVARAELDRARRWVSHFDTKIHEVSARLHSFVQRERQKLEEPFTRFFEFLFGFSAKRVAALEAQSHGETEAILAMRALVVAACGHLQASLDAFANQADLRRYAYASWVHALPVEAAASASFPSIDTDGLATARAPSMNALLCPARAERLVHAERLFGAISGLTETLGQCS